MLFYGKIIEGYRFAAAISIAIAWILGSFYDFYGKKIIGSDLIVALSVSFVFLFGALAIGQPTLFTWIIFILTFNNLLHMNAVEGGIKDADHDYKLNVNNLALKSGVNVKGDNIFIPKKFKVFGLGIRLFSSFLLLAPFIFYNITFNYWQIFILIIAIIGMLFFSIKLLSIKKFDRNKIKKYIAIQSFLRYSLVPIMLISIIGIIYSIIFLFLISNFFLVIKLLSSIISSFRFLILVVDFLNSLIINCSFLGNSIRVE